LRGHAHAVARSADGTFDEIADPQTTADLLRTSGFILVLKDGVPGQNRQRREPA
jgi:hypothetical protein